MQQLGAASNCAGAAGARRPQQAAFSSSAEAAAVCRRRALVSEQPGHERAHALPAARADAHLHCSGVQRQQPASARASTRATSSRRRWRRHASPHGAAAGAAGGRRAGAGAAGARQRRADRRDGARLRATCSCCSPPGLSHTSVQRAARNAHAPACHAQVFVAGATGNTGRRVVQQLRAVGYRVRAGVRVSHG